MKVSARNKIKGTVLEIVEGAVMASVKLDIGGGNTISSLISMESVKELDLKVGNAALAVIKSTEVMIGVPCCEKDEKKCGCGGH